MDAELVRVQDPPHTFPALTSSSSRPSTSTSDSMQSKDDPSKSSSADTAFPLAMPTTTLPTSDRSEPAPSILASLDLEEIDPTVFRSVGLWTPAGARGAFGGQVIGQALNAATRTVDSAQGRVWGLHSQHVRFDSLFRETYRIS